MLAFLTCDFRLEDKQILTENLPKYKMLLLTNSKVLSSFAGVQCLPGSDLERQLNIWMHMYIFLVTISHAQQYFELPSW